jgi:hypothetical protein
MLKNKFSIFIATFLIIGFFFLALPEKGYSGGPFLSFGCCKTEVGGSGGECIGCESGCATSQDFCEENDGEFFMSGASHICDDVDAMLGAECELTDLIDQGCCVTESGDCIESSFGGCLDDGLVGEIWFDVADCSEVPECEVNVVSAVPTLSEWGLIAFAGILGIVGFMVMRRRKVSA